MKTELIALLLWGNCAALAAQTDTTRHWGFGFDVAAGNVVRADRYEQLWLHENRAVVVGAEARYHTQPADSDAFARDYGYPVLAFGLRYGAYSGVRMRKFPAPDWGMAEMADYTSRMGDILTLHATFERPLLRSRRWQLDYTIGSGVGYGRHPYHPNGNVDNELIGSRWLLYFAAGLHATWRMAPHWGLRAGLDFAHHSNGALNRPNKGVNLVAPTVGVVYFPQEHFAGTMQPRRPRAPFVGYWYGTFTLGFGGKTLLDDWLITQYATPPSAPDYRTAHFRIHPSYTVQADLMRRYARRWASGVGFDLFYASCAGRIAEIDAARGLDYRHSPWSVGIAAKHAVFFHNFSLQMSLGCYLFRRMGFEAEYEEKPYYERIGIHYTFPRLHGLTIGCNVKAHATKADFTEIVIGISTRSGRKGR